MIFTIEPMINAGKPRHPRARRRLDHRHQGPQPVGAVGAHGARHRRRLRGADRCRAGTPAAAVAVMSAAAALAPTRSRAPRDRSRGATLAARARSAARRYFAHADAQRCSLRALRSSSTARVRALWTERRCRAGAALRRGRRLRPRRAVPVLRHRRAGAAAARAARRAERERARAASSARCWDIGLEIGHSVRTVDECVDEAAERRHGADQPARGALPRRQPRALPRASSARCTRALDPRAFFEAKKLEQEQRHAKYQDTPYTLEPNLKEARAACATCR